ncbi:MAG: aconitate hydratase B, partial [Gammaproteobacteria bacterium]|nr:aconitate hydratase B [Gammaproteobacteria bacterium]
MLEAYQNHVATRAAEGLVPEPLSAEWTSLLVERLQDATLDDGDVLLDLLTHRVPAGVDEAAYIKAGFLAAIAAGEAVSPMVTPKKAVELLGTMLGGYNVAPLIEALKNPELADVAVEGLSRTLLVFDAFHDVKTLADQGLMAAQKVLESWAAAEWFTARPKVPETITVTVFKVPGEINTDDLSPA